MQKVKTEFWKKEFLMASSKKLLHHFAGSQRSVSSVNSPLIAEDLFSRLKLMPI